MGTADASTARSRAHLVALLTASTEPEWLMFYGHHPQHPNTIDAACLSQWFPAPFTIGLVTYPTAEHWMMAAKARMFGDDNAWHTVMAASTPKEAKAAGRGVRAFDGQTWSAARFGLVVAGNLAKFGQNPALAEFLSSTAGAVLVEASPFDRVWGIGLRADHPDATLPGRWPGSNLLGFALMRVREQLAGGGA